MSGRLLAACRAGALVLAACTPSSPAREERARPASAREGSAAEPVERAVEAAPGAAQAAPEVTLAAEVGADAVGVVVQNRDSTPVKLSTALQIEREHANGFDPFATSAGLSLRASCDAPAPECVELVPGAELRPPPWQGPSGRTQCDEGASAKAPRGRYRFLAQACAGGPRIASDPFEID